MSHSYQAGGSPASLAQQFAQSYGCIPDTFRSIEQVQSALRNVGLESSSLIVAVDFTKSNEWAGKHTFGGQCLHAIGGVQNPYEKAISIIGQTLTPFDDDNLIPCFGFGDGTTHDQLSFSFFPDQRPCHGFQECLSRYRQIAPSVKLAGPTSFAPVIEQGVRAVEQSGGQYHVLLIIADGQVTRSSDLPPNQLSVQEQATVDAIVAASNYAMSIVLVGVGDGPWDTMRAYDDLLPKRNFDNFQFVEFSKLMSSYLPEKEKEAQFALAALMEIPHQYKACQARRLLGQRTGRMPNKMALPPPATVPAPMPYGQQPSYPTPAPYGQQPYPTLAPHGQKPSYPTPAPYGQATPAPYGQQSYPTPAPHGQQPSYPTPSPYGQQPSYPTPAPHGQQPSYPTPAPYGQQPYSTPAGGAYAGGYQAGQPPQYQAPPPQGSSYGGESMCPVCRTNRKNMAFQCGHQTCHQCGATLRDCPTCRAPIATRIKLY